MSTAVVSVAGRRVRWNTLRLLKAMRLSILVLTGVLLLVVVNAVQEHRVALRTVGKDAAPSIIAAQHIKSAMADMDAEAANELLQRPGVHGAASDAYEARRTEAVRALIGAAENITYGEAERAPIEAIQVGLGTYERLVQKARDLHDRGDTGAVPAYRDAASLMDDKLLPAADALDAANNGVLESTYQAQSFRSAATRFILLGVGVLVLLVLAGTQLFLSRRMQRTLNLPLLAATLLIAVLGAHFWGTLTRSHGQLKEAKEDAFTSLHALWRARSTAYAANSDESRYLLDPAQASGYEQAFTVKAAQLATLPAGLTAEQAITAARDGRKLEGFTGYLAEELNNVTFSGERDAALNTTATWYQYVTLDRQIRQLERTGQHEKAIALCTGTKVGESDWAFTRFDHALDETLAINQQAFDAAVQTGLTDLNGAETEMCIAAVVISVLVVLGFSPRIREYQ